MKKIPAEPEKKQTPANKTKAEHTKKTKKASPEQSALRAASKIQKSGKKSWPTLLKNLFSKKEKSCSAVVASAVSSAHFAKAV